MRDCAGQVHRQLHLPQSGRERLPRARAPPQAVRHSPRTPQMKANACLGGAPLISTSAFSGHSSSLEVTHQAACNRRETCRYGAAVIVMAFDEQGQAADCESKVRERASGRWGRAAHQNVSDCGYGDTLVIAETGAAPACRASFKSFRNNR